MNEKTSSTSTTQRIVGTAPRYNRKKVAGVGALAFAGLFAGGWIEGVPRIEKDLERRTEAKLAEVGFTGIEASFSGQDGTLRCATPLTVAERSTIIRLSEGKWGVRVAEFDDSCSGEGAPTAAPTTTVAAPTTSTEPAATTTENTTTESTAVTTTSDTTATTTTVAASAGAAVATYADGRIVLTGTVATEAQKQAMFDAAAQVVAEANIDNQIEVVADTAITDENIAALATWTAAMPPNLVSGETGFAAGKLYAKGIYLNDATKATFDAAAADVGATATLEARPTATTDDAAALKQELNDLVAAEPILFDPGRDTIKAESQATLDKVAAIANKYAGVAIAIQGHTDSQGGEAGNQTLSEQRAAAVLQALVQRNVDANQLTSVGFGETQLILENGVENATKSRRVVFDVATDN
jgi:outer membrane protein OmpA-like peptidoglycan-associated protein